MKKRVKFLKVLFCYLLSGISIIATGQESYSIAGEVIDDERKAVDLALVSIHNAHDTTYVKSEMTDQDGSFLLSNIATGDYLIKVNLLGYLEHSQKITINSNQEMLQIQISADAKILDEVTITGKVPFVERKIDRTVITPDALISNAGSNALEVLERAPGLSIDNNGSIVLKGRSGVAVFINDKPSYLSGAELENYLRSLPAGSIKSIEIMENPPAKYEAAGNSGVINIIIKRNTLKGFYGNTSLSYRRSRYNGSNNSLNLNYNRNKVSVYSNLYTGFWQNFQDLNINRYYRDEDNVSLSSFAQNSFNNRKGQYINGKIGIDFYPDEKTSFGVSYKQAASPGERQNDSNALVRNPSNVLTQSVVADNLDITTFDNTLLNFYVSRSLDSVGSKISFDADYVQYNTLNDQGYNNFIFGMQNDLIYQDLVNGFIPSDIVIYAAKSDYTKPLKDGSKFEAGLKTVFTKTDNEAIYSTTIGDVTTPDYNLSNQFVYDEQINAAYVNYSRSLGKFTLQGGLRGESTTLVGNQLGNPERKDTSFTRNYASLFPTFYASTKLDSSGNHGLNFSYGRRVDRPYFQDLNPFIRPLDRFTFYGGNPNLLPTFSHNLSLTYSYKSMINTSLSYSSTIDGINETLEIRDGIYYSRPGNIASSKTYTLSVDGSFEVNNWYRINSYVELAHLTFDSPLYTETLSSSGTYYYLSATNTFQLGNGWKADLSARYTSDVTYAQLIILSYGMVNAGIQKSIFEGKGSLKLSGNDLLYTRRGSGIINNLRQTDADWNSKYDSRNVTLTFSIRFGKSTSNKEKYNSSGSESEQRRVRG